MQYKEVAVGSTVYFWFAANLTTGAAGDGATPLYDVRLAGASSSAAPTASGTPTLLTHANYTDGLHEIAIDTTGYTQAEHAVFCTLTISSVNPAGFVGSFLVTAASSTSRDYLIAINAKTTNLPSDPADASVVAGLIAAVETKVDTVDTVVDGIAAKTVNLPSDPADASVIAARFDTLDTSVGDLPTNAELATALGTADDAVLTAIGDLPTNAELATALGTADDAVLAAIAALNNLSQANIRTAVGLGSANLDTQLGDLPTNAELATALGTADDAVLTAIADLPTNAELATALGTADDATLAAIAAMDAKIDTIDNLIDTEIGALTTELAKVPKSDGTATWNATALASLQQEATDALNAYDPPTHAEVTAAIAAGDDATLAAIAALNNISTAQVNAEVVDALNVDTYAEPTGVPAATATLVAKIGRLHQALRNRVNVTASKKTFYSDADSALWEKDLSDNTTTYSESEGNSP